MQHLFSVAIKYYTHTLNIALVCQNLLNWVYLIPVKYHTTVMSRQSCAYITMNSIYLHLIPQLCAHIVTVVYI